MRIFFACNTSKTGRLTLKEVVSADLFRSFMHVDEENEINRVRSFFSYEHFYVLYCRFFELDAGMLCYLVCAVCCALCAVSNVLS